ncbi:hypothetical protein I4I73_32185 [Pseudonocardia sp. KRD-184]|uniref:Secreted protein n=1 Tax=Pseudonocardia oceani TaxID=2792013 RepID=A0ABS6U4G9_9PSEU|nr:hypothetical protein [Pseudonocardia oceani]MBW0089869.1 hypothetical protein [Pseudonocardia oceani]MBW0100645.1 hypothetical protein [Pseudonocardia oceani]MBW0110148.1 hypothetical protein [Pseudonocardia oceani]MBW0123781.1 hypothetical protein [Pseudonocardia oceani]MBW0127054.1 hypothetical protein [Pseudonocardia oceani]
MNRYPREPSSLLRPARRTLWSRLAVPLAVLAVPVGTALGGALLTVGEPVVTPLTDHTVQIGCSPRAGCAQP